MKDGIVRVLEVVGAPIAGGAEKLIFSWFQSVISSGVVFDFVSHYEHECFYDSQIKELGGKIHYSPFISQIGAFKYIKRIHKIIKTNGPYVAVHAHTNQQACFVMIAAWLAGVKIRIAHAHTGSIKYKGTIKGEITLLGIRILNGIFATKLVTCEESASYLFFPRFRRVVYLPNSISIESYSCFPCYSQSIELRRQYNIPEKKKILGHVGRFVTVKNHRFLINLLNELDSEYYLVLIGDGPEYPEIRNLVNSMHLENRVTFIRETKEIGLHMNMIDVFLMSSFFEGLPVVALEAQAAGVPCLLSDRISRRASVVDYLVTFEPIDGSGAILNWGRIIRSMPCKYNSRNIFLNRSKEFDRKGFSLAKSIKVLRKLYHV
jgi:glycosyltransferase EpsF